MKRCIACGMPMTEKEDYAMGNEMLDYCVHCSRADGSMQSYGEKLESLTGFIVKTQGFDPGAAKAAAISMMKDLPAWKGMLS